MTQPPPTAPARPGAPGPAARGLIALVVRLTLGVALLDAGVTGYLLQKAAATAVPPPPAFAAYFNAATPPPTPTPPGMEGYAAFIPYVEIVAGVALVLGFFTTAAATAAALGSVLRRALRLFSLLLVAMPEDVATLAAYGADLVPQLGMLPNLLLSVAMIWLAASGDDRFSIDALVWRRPEPTDAPPPAHGQVTGDQIPDVPAVGSVNPVVKEFDPDLYVEIGPAGGESR